MDFVIDQIVAAPPETVFDVLTDHRAYPNFTPIRGAELDPEGSPDPNGVGAVRVLTVVGPPLRERVPSSSGRTASSTSSSPARR